MTAAWRFYFLMPVRAWKATTPDLNGHRPQIAGNRNADRIARPSPSLQSHNPARRHAAAARPPRWCAVGAAPARGNGGPPSGRGAVLRVSGRTRPVTGDTTPYDQRPAELHNPRITQATYMSIWESAHLAGLRNCIGLDYPFAFYLVTVCRLLDHHQLNLSH
jgi:hypothetical protein